MAFRGVHQESSFDACSPFIRVLLSGVVEASAKTINDIYYFVLSTLSCGALQFFYVLHEHKQIESTSWVGGQSERESIIEHLIKHSADDMEFCILFYSCVFIRNNEALKERKYGCQTKAICLPFRLCCFKQKVDFIAKAFHIEAVI